MCSDAFEIQHRNNQLTLGDLTGFRFCLVLLSIMFYYLVLLEILPVSERQKYIKVSLNYIKNQNGKNENF